MRCGAPISECPWSEAAIPPVLVAPMLLRPPSDPFDWMFAFWLLGAGLIVCFAARVATLLWRATVPGGGGAPDRAFGVRPARLAGEVVGVALVVIATAIAVEAIDEVDALALRTAGRVQVVCRVDRECPRGPAGWTAAEDGSATRVARHSTLRYAVTADRLRFSIAVEHGFGRESRLTGGVWLPLIPRASD